MQTLIGIILIILLVVNIIIQFNIKKNIIQSMDYHIRHLGDKFVCMHDEHTKIISFINTVKESNYEITRVIKDDLNVIIDTIKLVDRNINKSFSGIDNMLNENKANFGFNKPARYNTSKEAKELHNKQKTAIDTAIEPRKKKLGQ